MTPKERHRKREANRAKLHAKQQPNVEVGTKAPSYQVQHGPLFPVINGAVQVGYTRRVMRGLNPPMIKLF